MASHPLIDTHLAALARRLPADAVDELADGLTETWHHHLATGRPPAEAARAAIAEFGSATQITEAFATNCPGRRTARILLGTGPCVGRVAVSYYTRKFDRNGIGLDYAYSVGWGRGIGGAGLRRITTQTSDPRIQFGPA